MQCWEACNGKQGILCFVSYVFYFFVYFSDTHATIEQTSMHLETHRFTQIWEVIFDSKMQAGEKHSYIWQQNSMISNIAHYEFQTLLGSHLSTLLVCHDGYARLVVESRQWFVVRIFREIIIKDFETRMCSSYSRVRQKSGPHIKNGHINISQYRAKHFNCGDFKSRSRIMFICYSNKPFEDQLCIFLQNISWQNSVSEKDTILHRCLVRIFFHCIRPTWSS